MLVLDCARIDQKCPRFPFANVGGDSCDVNPPRIIDQVFHHTIPQEGHGTFEVPLSSSTLIVENAASRISVENAGRAASTPMIYGPTSSGWASPPGGIHSK